jgi:hypothetical protein
MRKKKEKISLKDDEFYRIFHSKGKSHFEQLYFVNKKKFTKGCGSYLFNGKKYNYDKSLYEKQKLLFELCKTNNKVLEIGSYMGHSILIMLLANPKIHVTAIDINDHYAKPSLKYLQKKFPKSKINFINNDSIKALGSLKEKFDLFHLDGAHEHEVISKEFLLCINLRKSNKLKILFDDVSSIKYLKDNILKNFQIMKNFIPNSNYPNFYAEIKIDNKKLKQNLKRFKFENFIIFIKYRLIKILLKNLFFNEMNATLYKFFLKNFKIIILEKIKHKLFNFSNLSKVKPD